MFECPAGTYREAVILAAISGPLPFLNPTIALKSSPILDNVTQCDSCPYGTYRSATKGSSPLSCSKCPVGKYANQTGAVILLDNDYRSKCLQGSTSETNCLRCPAGTFTAEEGARFCICITAESCDMPEPTLQGQSSVDYFKNGVDYYRETVPYEGRW